MKALLHWIFTFCDDNYRTAYWESVAQNEAWLRLLMELNDESL